MSYESPRYFISFQGRDFLARSLEECEALAECFVLMENPDEDSAQVFKFLSEGRSSMVAQVSVSDGKLDIWRK